MKLIKQKAELLYVTPNAEEHIERAGRICYKSESKIDKGTAEIFVGHLKKLGHLSVIEHAYASFLFVTNRGVSHELVRHRLASYSQESTRYVRYQDTEYIEPTWYADATDEQKRLFEDSLSYTEICYGQLLKTGWRPEQAREVLPNALKTEIVMTANLREWVHVFKLRCSNKAHPQIRDLMYQARTRLWEQVPVLFK